jgi:hypothetical protein
MELDLTWIHTPVPVVTLMYVKQYYLSFPPFVGVNVRITQQDNYILPSSSPIALGWSYFPALDAPPHIFATTTNDWVGTGLRLQESGRISISIDTGIPLSSDPLIVIQFIFYEQRWIVFVHEVYFPSIEDASITNFHLALQNRTEKLVVFYDSKLEGLGSFTHRHLTIHLTPEQAVIQYATFDLPNYYIQPYDRSAFCMFIDPWRRGGGGDNIG